LIKKASLYLPIIGSILYFIGFIFMLYAINHPESGFIFETTKIMYYSYVVILCVALIGGSVLRFFEGFDNVVQKRGAIVFLIGVLLFILMFLFLIITLFTTINLGIFSFMNTNGFYVSCFSFVFILFVAGIMMSRYKQSK